MGVLNGLSLALAVKAAVPIVVKAVKNTVTKLAKAVVSTVVTTGKLALEAVKDAASFVKDKAIKIFNSAKDALKALLQALIKVGKMVVGAISTFASKAFSTIKDFIKDKQKEKALEVEPEGTYPGQANCYAYAMKLEYDPRTGEPFARKPQPGEFAGDILTYNDIIEEPDKVKNTIVSKVQADAPILGLTFTEVSSATHVPKPGNWVVALALDTGDSPDYHWWRRNNDGTWSHKPGSTPIVHLDSSGNVITDPATCDRGRYDAFLGFYEVGPE